MYIVAGRVDNSTSAGSRIQDVTKVRSIMFDREDYETDVCRHVDELFSAP